MATANKKRKASEESEDESPASKRLSKEKNFHDAETSIQQAQIDFLQRRASIYEKHTKGVETELQLENNNLRQYKDELLEGLRKEKAYGWSANWKVMQLGAMVKDLEDDRDARKLPPVTYCEVEFGRARLNVVRKDADIAELKAKVAKLEADKESVQTRMELERAEAAEVASKSQSQLRELQAQVDALKAAPEELRKENEELGEKLGEALRAVQTEAENTTAVREEYDAFRQHYNTRRDAWRTKYCTAKDATDAAAAERQDMEKANAVLEQEKTSWEHEKFDLEGKVQRLQKARDAESEAYDLLSKEHDALKVAAQDLWEEREILKASVSRDSTVAVQSSAGSQEDAANSSPPNSSTEEFTSSAPSEASDDSDVDILGIDYSASHMLVRGTPTGSHQRPMVEQALEFERAAYLPKDMNSGILYMATNFAAMIETPRWYKGNPYTIVSVVDPENFEYLTSELLVPWRDPSDPDEEPDVDDEEFARDYMIMCMLSRIPQVQVEAAMEGEFFRAFRPEDKGMETFTNRLYMISCFSNDISERVPGPDELKRTYTAQWTETVRRLALFPDFMNAVQDLGIKAKKPGAFFNRWKPNVLKGVPQGEAVDEADPDIDQSDDSDASDDYDASEDFDASEDSDASLSDADTVVSTTPVGQGAPAGLMNGDSGFTPFPQHPQAGFFFGRPSEIPTVEITMTDRDDKEDFDFSKVPKGPRSYFRRYHAAAQQMGAGNTTVNDVSTVETMQGLTSTANPTGNFGPLAQHAPNSLVGETMDDLRFHDTISPALPLNPLNPLAAKSSQGTALQGGQAHGNGNRAVDWDAEFTALLAGSEYKHFVSKARDDPWRPHTALHGGGSHTRKPSSQPGQQAQSFSIDTTMTGVIPQGPSYSNGNMQSQQVQHQATIQDDVKMVGTEPSRVENEAQRQAHEDFLASCAAIVANPDLANPTTAQQKARSSNAGRSQQHQQSQQHKQTNQRMPLRQPQHHQQNRQPQHRQQNRQPQQHQQNLQQQEQKQGHPLTPKQRQNLEKKVQLREQGDTQKDFYANERGEEASHRQQKKDRHHHHHHQQQQQQQQQQQPGPGNLQERARGQQTGPGNSKKRAREHDQQYQQQQPGRAGGENGNYHRVRGGAKGAEDLWASGLTSHAWA